MQVNIQRGGLTVRMLHALAVAGGDFVGASAYAASKGMTAEARLLEKAAVDPLGLDSTELQPFRDDVAAVLRDLSAFDRLMALGAVRVEPNTRLHRQTVRPTASWVADGAPVPVLASGYSSQASALNSTSYVAALAVVTAELLRAAVNGGTEAALGPDLVGALADAVDAAAFDPSARANAPVALTHPDNAAQQESTGSTLAAIDADLQAALKTLTDAGSNLARAAWVVRPRTASYLAGLRDSGSAPAFPTATARGGSLYGLPLLVTGGIATLGGSPDESLIALIDAASVIYTDSGVRAELTTHAAIELLDNPSQPAQLVSLWQNGLAATKQTRRVNWRNRRPGTGAVAIRSVTY